MRASWTSAALTVTASGMPRASATRWRFVPDPPRSVGFGPASEPPFAPARLKSRGRRATGRRGPPRSAFTVAPGATAARRRRCATGASGASRSSRCRSPSRAGGTPRAAPSRGRRGCRAARRGRGCAAARLSPSAAPGEQRFDGGPEFISYQLLRHAAECPWRA